MSLLDLIPAPARAEVEAIAIVIALALAGACGWMVNGWRLGTQLQAERTHYAQEQRVALAAAVKQRDDAIKDRDALAGKLASIDQSGIDNLRRFEHANQTLAAGADAGSVRVRVIGAACPASHDVPQASPGSGVDSSAGAELGADARRRYFALRGTLGQVQQQLSACQDAVRAITGQGAPQ